MTSDRLNGYRAQPQIKRLDTHQLKKSGDGLELECLSLQLLVGPEEDERVELLEIRAGREKLFRLYESLRHFLKIS